MKIHPLIRAVLFFFLVNSSVFAQENADVVDVSSDLQKGTSTKECNKLELGKVVSAPEPIYPAAARRDRIGGNVEVEITISEKGSAVDVINIKGNNLFQASALEAAKKTMFTPTICDGRPVRINGLMVYNFIPYIITENYFTPGKIEDYTDISDETESYESILYLTENYNLTFGYGDKRFHPAAPLTKGDFVHFLRLTLDLLEQRAKFANRVPSEIGLFTPFNPMRIKSTGEIKDLTGKLPYYESARILHSKYNVVMVDKNKNFYGRYPMTLYEVVDFWENIFGKDSIPIYFQKDQKADKIFTRGEFSLFLQESLYVLTYKVLP